MALRLPKADLMASVEAPILPGSNVVVNEIRSIYNGYSGCVQGIRGDRAAVLFEVVNWDKLVTIPLKHLLLA